MRSKKWWIGWGLILGLVLGLPAQGEPDPEAVRKLMERYQREAAPTKPAATPKPRTNKPAPKPRPKPTPKPRSKKPAPAPIPTSVVPTSEPVVSSRVDAPAMVRIPGGCFEMGSPESEEDRSSDERQHRVCVEAFEIGQYEVTQGQWQAVMGDNPSDFKNGDDYPVENVSWDDIQGYLTKLNARTGRNYRLPTEAEWEYACRGGVTGQRYCGGDDPDRLAWYDANSGSQPQPVGRKTANGFGLYDMSGNVWEWTCSLYDAEYGGAAAKCIYGDTSGLRSLRGGSWFYLPARVRSANRFGDTPANRDSLSGFRLARSL